MSLGILLSRQKTTNITDAVSLILHLTTSVCVTVNKATQINNYYIALKSNESKIHPIKYHNYIVCNWLELNVVMWKRVLSQLKYLEF